MSSDASSSGKSSRFPVDDCHSGRLRKTALLGLALLTVPSLTAQAQTLAGSSASGAARQSETSEQAIELSPIVVTGEAQPGAGPNLFVPSRAGSRLSMTPLETPASVETIPGQVMLDRGQTSINEAIAANATGIASIGNHFNGGTSVAARGFVGNGSVTRLYDGVRLYPGSNTLTFPFDTWTADRIEVLHGPASVLYGEGGIGGAINVIPKKPLFDRRRNEVLATVGSYGQYGLAVGSAGPIGDRFAYSIDVSGRGSNGWMERGDAKSLAISAALAWKVTDDWKLTLSHDYGYNEPSAYSGTPTVNGRMSSALRKQNYGVLDSLVRFQDQFTQLHSEWKPTESITINGRLYHIETDRDWRTVDSYTWIPATNRINRTGNTIIGQRMTQYGGVLDATVKTNLFGLRNETVVGFDANAIRFKRSLYYSTAATTSLDPFNFFPGYFGSAYAPTIMDSDTRQYSVFADHRVRLTDQLSVVAGLRYDSPHVDVLNPSTGARYSATLDSVNWRVGAVYEVVKDTAIYAQYSRASDAFGSIASLAQNQKDLRLPRGVQYEAGIKTALFDGRLQATLSAYKIEKRDLLASDPLNPTVTNQIGQQSSEGIEGSVGIDLGYGIRVDANGTILRAKYDNYLQAGGNFTGNVPANVPQRMANIWASWDFAPRWTVYGGLNHVGSAYANDANTMKRPAYTLVNAGLRWKPAESTTVSLHAQNLTDETYAIQSIGSSQWFLGTPRTVTLTLHTVF